MVNFLLIKSKIPTGQIMDFNLIKKYVFRYSHKGFNPEHLS